MAFFFKPKPTPKPFAYDPKRQQPAVRRSICTGEMTGGLVDLDTGAFHEIELLRDQRELEAFCARAGVAVGDVRTIY